MNAILNLDRENAEGVVTHSSGNHGQALAWAASIGLVINTPFISTLNYV